MTGAGPLVPTFHGFVHNSMDGLVLFEACLSGKLHHVPRRPHDRERSQLIKSGSIFIYEENASGIKRWTDGVAWSPSRILGNFLIYRELEKPFPPGEKKRAMKRKRASIPGEPYPRQDSNENERVEAAAPLTPPSPNVEEGVKNEASNTDQDKELERSLIGSLVDSYGFRPDGLVKKTMSISVNGISHHMVSYYKVDDVKNNLLPRPASDPRLQNIMVRPELYLKQNFRAPVEETEHYAIDGNMHAHPQMMYSTMAPSGYGVRPGQYFGQPQYQPAMYSMASSAPNLYGGMTGTSWPAHSTSSGPIAYGSQPAYAPPSYSNYYKAPGQAPPPVKAEEQSGPPAGHSYGNQYASSYSAIHGRGNETPSMVQSSYQTPVQSSSSSFGTIGGQGNRTPYSGSGVASPPADGRSQSLYSQPQAPQALSNQAYAVRSPAQGYGMHSAPIGTQSPHPAAKSPRSATMAGPQSHEPYAPAYSNQMPYRGGSYAVAGTSNSSNQPRDMNGLGISSGSSYSTQQAPQGYHGYGTTGQMYRPEVASSTYAQ
ncbi:hypothetical protein MBLNU230_g2132t1 [Neophaeotheca triangularis]